MDIAGLTDINNFNKLLEELRSKGYARKNEEIVEKTGYNKTTISNYLTGKRPLSIDFVRAILVAYNLDENKVLYSFENTDNKTKRNLIPLYSDVYTIGSANALNNSTTNGEIAEYIDAGDWFPGATAAIRHYNDSMLEYPSGCILALRDIVDLKNGFVFGQDYVVEYGEDWNRVTKRIQKGKSDVLMGYSTNRDKYDDGVLIHQPIELINIHKAWRVLGYVVKKESGTGVVKVTGKK